MPKSRKEEFDVDAFLEINTKAPTTDKVGEVKEEETVIVDTKEVEADFTQPKNRVASALVNQAPTEDGGDWQTEQDIDLGDYKANRIKTERQAEVDRIKTLQVENREQIKTMMGDLHGQEAAEVERDENEKTLSKKSLLAQQEKQRLEEANEISIVDTMMGELFTNYRPRDK